jgi:hypothetical protein
MSAPDAFIREINAQPVSPSLLGEVMHLWASLPRDEWADFDRRLERVVELVSRTNSCEQAPMLAMAAALRLMAVDTLVVDPAFRGWLITERSRRASPTFTGIFCGSRPSRRCSKDPPASPSSTGLNFARALWSWPPRAGALSPSDRSRTVLTCCRLA